MNLRPAARTVRRIRFGRKALAGFATLAVCWLIPGQVVAATIAIDDLSDTIVISWTGFRDSVYIGGQQSLPDGSVQLAESVNVATGFPTLFAFSGFFDSPGGDHWTQNNNTVIYFREADGGISDVLQVGFDVRGDVTLVSGVFTSDVEGSPLWTAEYLTATFGPADLTIDEGTNIEITNYLKAPLPPGFASLLVSSDAEGTAVPEPGTLALLSLGLAGLGMSRRRNG